jgi:hypothetical protein
MDEAEYGVLRLVAAFGLSLKAVTSHRTPKLARYRNQQ